MRISGFSTVRPNMSDTRLYEDLTKFLGDKPARLGLIATLYDGYTASHLTEALFNTYTLSEGKKNSFQSVNSFMIEWDLEVKEIHRVPMVAAPKGTGENAGDILFYFAENYYQPGEVFVIERTRQQIYVAARPQRVNDKCWMVVGKINDDSYDSTLVGNPTVGDTTRFLTNYKAELHETGYSKYQSNTEKHRVYMATHRADVDMSAKYKPMEEVFIQIGKGSDGDPVYKMNTAEKDCLETYMAARNNSCLLGKCNVDASGKPKIYDEIGRPVISTDGIIPQVERFANKFIYSKLNTKLFNKAIMAMITKCEKSMGNTFTIVANTALMAEVQEVLGAWLADHKTDGAALWSRKSNGYVEVGATYQAYEFMGNKILLKHDRALDVEFPYRPFGAMIDLTADVNSGKPAIAMFTFKGGQYIHNIITGVGGKTGLQSGEVSSPVAGSKIIDWGYASVGVFNPYKSVILMGSESVNPLF